MDGKEACENTFNIVRETKIKFPVDSSMHLLKYLDLKVDYVKCWQGLEQLPCSTGGNVR
jgi:hypothetical protein